jgi:hypothetical protein
MDEERITVIARTLGQASVFNEVVREQTEAVQIGERYKQIAQGFDSIRTTPRRWSTRSPMARSALWNGSPTCG